MNRKELIKETIKERLATLKELGNIYSEEKIDTLATNLAATNKTLTEISTLIDNKFANQVRKNRHNKHLASLREYYISSIDKLKKGNNCYLLSYEQGVKVLEQAYIAELSDVNPFLKLVSVNNRVKGYKKENSLNNDYELIMSDIAYLLNIPYAKTYRIFDAEMNPKGIVNLSFVEESSTFLSLEEALRFIKEESPKFTLTQELLGYHDKNVKHGLQPITNPDDYRDNLQYVFKLFAALPDITEENIAILKRDYLNMKIFELLTNSLNNNLSNIGLMVNKENRRYTYSLSPSYNKYTIELSTIGAENTICNFFIVNKRELLATIINLYYEEVKETLHLITDNKDTLISIIDQVLKEHLEYGEFNKYHDIIVANINMITSLVKEKEQIIPISQVDKETYEENNSLYNNRIAPFFNNYISDEYESEKGSTLLLGIVTAVLFITIGIILLTIYAVSKMQM